MKNTSCSLGRLDVKAFTLIELLVVVLIIGILASVALPQYQKAVVKSRVSTIIPVGQAIWEAKEAYYMANGEYVRDIEVLGLDVPTNCVYFRVSYYRCGKYFLLDNNRKGPDLNYCPEHLTSLDACRAYQDFRLTWSSLQQPENSQFDKPGERYCFVHNNSNLGKEICKNLAGFTYGTDGVGAGRTGY